MLASGTKPTPKAGNLSGEPEEGPSADELTMPVARTDSPAALVRSVQRSQEVRVAVAVRFEEIFEFYVTAGRADDYQGLVARFNARFEALSSNLERAAAALETAKQPPLARLVRSVAREEAAHLEAALQVQVLRQRLSVSDSESESHAEIKQVLQVAQARVSKSREAIFETLDELRCEAADLDE